jgi:hypothetical protein
VPAGVAPVPSPFLNPLVNPYLNPYLANTQVPPDVALYYMLQNQRASGGIGSGAMSGLLEAEQRRTGQLPAARKKGTQSVATTGRGATRYFQRGPGRFGSRSASYFQRYGDRFDQ